MTWIILLWIFQGYSLFSYQCSLLFLATLICYHTQERLSTTFLFFFSAFLSWCVVAFRQLWYSTKSSFVCQELFHFSFQMFQFFATAWLFYQIIRRLSTTFLKKIRTTHISNQSGERGIWTLAPVTRPIPLAGAPLRPLEYFSKVHNCQYDVVRYVCDAFNILLNFYLFVNPYFLYFILPVTVASFQTGIDPAYIFVNITP